ncbi:aspartate aminotransferase [Candidatus Pantoea edessiphila]|uniref:cysteine-S-conjugate beta-lyase n=1 Tax=Candidatus Pantoea edessiphila TaxID=2044610 RepID=A0A2P5SYL5_9GAMM|nr:PatB family C-S lyase [Candidatus Pantoea edessiphila]MBK4775446.1 putative C-S lyase [Pantoea sp. Edef]PPI87426.1 aspartate aminotransferase [Candidatus Pantoea edessiphila]
MISNFDQQIERRFSDSAKWNKYKGKDIIPLWVADTDFKSPKCIIDAINNRVSHGIFGYGKKPTLLIDIFINYISKKFNWSLDPEWIVVLPGIVSGLHLSVRTFTCDHERIITPIPIYPPFRNAAKLANRDQLNIPLVLKNRRWVLDLNITESKINHKEKLLMLCNPQNPGGTVYTRKELMDQLNFAQQNNLIVCSDEIHCDLILEPKIKHIPFGSLSSDAAQRSITLMSPSKSFNIAGLGASIAIIPNRSLRNRFVQARQGIIPEVNILAIVAAEAAWLNGHTWLKYLIDYLRNNRDFLVSQLNLMPELSMVSPEATYLGWIDVSNLNINNPQMYFENHGLGFSSGMEFGNNNFIRFNFGCTRITLKKAIRRLKRALEQYNISKF